MLMNKRQLIACIVLCAALAACTGIGPSPKKLTAKDAGSTIHVKVGDVIEVALDGNPTTGYTWEEAPGASELLAQQGEPEFKASSSAIGSGGTMTLRFKALQQGTYPLKLIYHRTFEPGVAPLQIFEANILVE
jgi:inhibitor of cysteine peptidase